MEGMTMGPLNLYVCIRLLNHFSIYLQLSDVCISYQGLQCARCFSPLWPNGYITLM